MTDDLAVPVLTGPLVRLEPLGHHHATDLVTAATEDRATFDWARVPDGPEAVEAYVRRQLDEAAAGHRVPFVQVRPRDGRAVGCTSLLNIRRAAADDRVARVWAVEVGSTWLAASHQGTGINVCAKSLLLSHVFDTWGVERVDLKTDARNERARAAILGLGARFEGVLRCWQPSQVPGEETRLRDTAMYSILRREWPAVREHLTHRVRLFSPPNVPL